MDVILLYPPGGNLQQPYTSLPCLTAALREKGFSVLQKDLDIESIDYYCNPARLLQAKQAIEKKMHKSCSEDIKRYLEFTQNYHAVDYTAANIEEAKRLLRTPDGYKDYDLYCWCRNLLRRSQDIISAEFEPYRWPNIMEELDRTALEASLQDTLEIESYIFNQFFNEKMEFLKDLSVPPVVGISITYSPQLIPALFLANAIRKINKEIHIVIGGAFLLSVLSKLDNPDDYQFFFDYVDSIILGDGETALCRLAEKIKQGEGDLSDVPNILYRENNKILRGPALVEDLNALPTPDFSGLPLEQYLSPGFIILIAISRGCYWGKCAFCELHGLSQKKYRARNMELVIDDIRKLTDKYRSPYFVFSIEAFPPKLLEKFCVLVREQKLEIFWQSEVRFEPSFTEEFCRTLYASGCRQLIFGLESANQRVLDLMDKGTRLENNIAILDNCYKAGIATSMQSFIGFPTETVEEATDTFNFFAKHADKINSYAMGKYILIKNSRVYKNPDQYGITAVRSLEKNFMGKNNVGNLNFTFDTVSGMTREKADELYKTFSVELQKYYPFILGNNGIDIHGMVFTALYGADFFQNLKRKQKENKKNVFNSVFSNNGLSFRVNTAFDFLKLEYGQRESDREFLKGLFPIVNDENFGNHNLWLVLNNANGTVQTLMSPIDFDGISSMADRLLPSESFMLEIKKYIGNESALKSFLFLYDLGLIDVIRSASVRLKEPVL